MAIAGGIVTLRRNLDYRSPLALWGVTVADRPGSAQAQASFGRELAAQGRNAEATEHYNQALQLSPPDVRHCDLGLACDEAGRPEAALAEYVAALDFNPNLAFAQLKAGRDLYLLGRWPEAERRLRAGLAASPREGKAIAEGQLLLGSCLAQMDRPDEAVGAIQRAVDLEPDSAIGHGNLAAALDQAGRTGKALEEYRRALALQSNYPEACFNLGKLLLRLGRTEDARQQFARALALNPSFREAKEALQRISDSQAIP